MKRRSYTLLEMIIAIMIFLMIMMTVGMGSVSIQKTWSRVQKHSNLLKSYQMIDRAVVPAFKNAVPFNWKDENGGTKSLFIGDQNSLTLAYLHRINRMSEGGIRFLRLFLENEQLIAEYRNTPILYWAEDDTQIRREVLSSNVRGIDFSYALKDEDKLQWESVWDDKGFDIPVAIQMTIEWENGDSEVWLRRTAGSGFKEELNVRN